MLDCLIIEVRVDDRKTVELIIWNTQTSNTK